MSEVNREPGEYEQLLLDPSRKGVDPVAVPQPVTRWGLQGL